MSHTLELGFKPASLVTYALTYFSEISQGPYSKYRMPRNLEAYFKRLKLSKQAHSHQKICGRRFSLYLLDTEKFHNLFFGELLDSLPVQVHRFHLPTAQATHPFFFPFSISLYCPSPLRHCFLILQLFQSKINYPVPFFPQRTFWINTNSRTDHQKCP